MLLGACFLVNYVTVDEKTNMSEGLTMISFYAMIVSGRYVSFSFPVFCLLAFWHGYGFMADGCDRLWPRGSIQGSHRSRSCSIVQER